MFFLWLFLSSFLLSSCAMYSVVTNYTGAECKKLTKYHIFSRCQLGVYDSSEYVESPDLLRKSTKCCKFLANGPCLFQFVNVRIGSVNSIIIQIKTFNAFAFYCDCSMSIFLWNVFLSCITYKCICRINHIFVSLILWLYLHIIS